MQNTFLFFAAIIVQGENEMNAEDKNSKLRFTLICECIILGALTGCVISAFRFLISKSLVLLSEIYHIISLKPALIIIWIILLIIIGDIIGSIVKKEPLISGKLPQFSDFICSYFADDRSVMKGNKLPESEDIEVKELDFKWFRVIAGKFIGSVISIGTGLSLGIEGPSVQLGIAMGQVTGRIFKKIKQKEKFFIISGASAGLSAAFNAPLAGVVYTMEKVHEEFSPFMLLLIFISALSSDFTASRLFNMKSELNFNRFAVLPTNYYLYLIILGIISAVISVVFNKILAKTEKLFSDKGRLFSRKSKIAALLLFSIAFGFYLPQVMGGGYGLINSLCRGDFTIRLILVLFLAKFLFTIMSYGSGAPGGVFVPVLAIGALIGAVYGNALLYVFHIDNSYMINFIVLAMAAYFSAALKSPITGCILVTEITGSFNHIIALGLISVIAYIVTDFMNSNSMPILNKAEKKQLVYRIDTSEGLKQKA